MGKKDNEIEILELRNHIRILKGEVEDKNYKIEGIEDEKAEFENAAKLEFEKQNEIYLNTLQQYQAKIKELQNHKSLLIVSVQIIGGNAIDATLDNAEKLIESRLEKIGLKGKYIILSKPNTIGIEIVS